MSHRILIIEDHPINRELIDYLLRAHGFETLKAVDGLLGLDIALREKPDLILCDIQMPGIDGVEFARRAKADPTLRAIPLVAVTALAMVGDRDRIVAEGFDGYVSKPIEPAEFIPAITALLPQRGDAVAAPAEPRRRRILALDDTPYNLELKRDLLGPHGYEVVTASSAAEAWQAAQAQRPDLVIADVSAGAGFELIRRMKADATLRDVPFLFLTSTHWDEASRRTAMELGASRYLLRPLEPERLLAEIEALLAGG